MEIKIPEFSLVMMVGPSSTGKTTWARRHFAESEIISSDRCRYLVSDDYNDQSASTDAFDLLHHMLNIRLKNRRLTVIDATNLQADYRQNIAAIARNHQCGVVVVAMKTKMDICVERGEQRDDRPITRGALRRQFQALNRSMRDMRKERYQRIHVIDTPEEADASVVVREPMHNNLRHEHGPFDIIGDIHGCYHELAELLEQMGYQSIPDDGIYRHPEGRKAVLVGDLVDRGPHSDLVLELVMNMVASGDALCVSGNHDDKLRRYLRGNNVTISHGLDTTIAQMEHRTPEFKEQVAKFLRGLRSHYMLDDGKLAVAHAGILEEYQGRNSGTERQFCHYGLTTGETDQQGMPVRLEWAQDYRGDALVVFGHTTVEQPRHLNNTINIDTGCVFGGKLTAFRYPERETFSVPALRAYYQYAAPEPDEPPSDGGEQDAGVAVQSAPTERPPHALDIRDVTGPYIVHTRTHGNIRVSSEHARSALETVSRFSVDPRVMVYIPPTMAPAATSDLPDILEHTDQALAQYREDGIDRVVVEEKHMGSRAIMILGKDDDTIEKAFGYPAPAGGICYSRNGRDFFNNAALHEDRVKRARAAVGKAGLWEELDCEWLMLDCEIMPWSLKAGRLLTDTYAPAAAAGISHLDHGDRMMEMAVGRGLDVDGIHGKVIDRLHSLNKYRLAYRRYCWQVDSPDDVQIASFQILATNRELTALSEPHGWHAERGGRLAVADPYVFRNTQYCYADPSDPDDVAKVGRFWEGITSGGGEGVVVKPNDPAIHRHGDPSAWHRIQPGVKVRGPEYLRIIYGPEYILPDNLERLRRRGLGTKRQLAVREYALGIEGLQRLLEGEPLYRVHQCAFGVLALESEPTDPRL